MTKPLGITFAVSLLFATLLAACPSPKMPTGPSPEYEEPARPSWFEAGAPAPSPPPAPPPAQLPQDGSAD